ncbi:hypothetical protein [Bradyrhizobium guangdongense]
MDAKQYISALSLISTTRPIKIVGSDVEPLRLRSCPSHRRKPEAYKGHRPLPRRGLSREQSADYFGVSASKFDQMRKDGRIGPPRLIDGRKVWDIYQLDRDFDALLLEGGEDVEDWDATL